MKILQIIPRLDLGGGETMCEALCLGLKKRENELLVVSLYHDETVICKRLNECGVPVVFLNKHKRFDFSIVRKIHRIIKDFKPDIIHTHLFSLKYTVLATLFSKKKIVHTVHNEAKKEVGWFDRRFNNFFYKTGKVKPIALSEGICNSIKTEYHLKEIPVVYNGVDLSNCIIKKNYASKKRLIILSIGRLTKQKNYERLLRAFAKLHNLYPDSLLKIIGIGELLETLKETAKLLEIENSVQFLGEKSNVFPYLNEADFFCLSSDYEGLPMVLIEAMGTGLPIVSTNVGGVSDLIDDEKTGLLCSCDDDDLFEKMSKLAGSIRLREKLGMNALLTVNKFSSDNMTECYLNIYKQVISKTKK